MTENNSINPIFSILEIKTQSDEEENYYVVEELDEIENPLQLQQADSYDYDASMDATNVQDRNYSSDDSNRKLSSLPRYQANISTKRPKRFWNFTRTKEMLNIYKAHKPYLERLRKEKEKYEFIAKKVNELNPDQSPIKGTAIESKLKLLIRTYRLSRSRKNHRPKTNIDLDVEEIYGYDRLMKWYGLKLEKVVPPSIYNKPEPSHNKPNYDYLGDGQSTSSTNTSAKITPVASNILRETHVVQNCESQTSRATQTDLGDNLLMQMVQIEKNQQKRWEEEKILISRVERARAERFSRKLMQIVQIEKNQQKRWEEEKVLISRVERAKAEKFSRKESLLQELVDVLKSRQISK